MSVGGSAIYIIKLNMLKLFFPKRISKKLLTLHYINGGLCQTKFNTKPIIKFECKKNKLMTKKNCLMTHKSNHQNNANHYNNKKF